MEQLKSELYKILNVKTHLVLGLARVLVGVLSHGPRLGVVMRRVGVEVAQVLGRVLPDPQVAHRVPILIIN